VCDVAGTRVSLQRVEIGIEIATVNVIVIVNVNVTVDSMGGMEGLRRMDHLLEETISGWACRAEMIEGVLGM
jgi:hypothetical protein